ncbi:MAG: hypothetical protein KatS3mg010_1529 [Acidimicrobiia bacterium]|nr:MAG: hypothetical protein KatS3mg010_1529 [Acidimicrobiia bacterium]
MTMIPISEIRAKEPRQVDLPLQRELRQRELDRIIADVERAGRDHLLADEQRRFDRTRRELAEIDGILARVADEQRREAEKLRREYREREQAALESAERFGDTKERPIYVGGEPPVYHEHGEHSLVRDLLHATEGDWLARDRLTRHAQMTAHETRDVGTGAFTGLVPPQYLTDLFAPLARAMGPTVQVCNRRPLPPTGMTLNVSRITTGTAVAAQQAENSAVQETDADDTLLTVNVRTIAGMQDVSRQAIERGVGVDEAVLADLANAYFTELDRQILNSDGTSGTHLGIRSTSGISTVTYTDASPTVGEFYSKLADAISQVNTLRFAPATVIVMHPRRWAWVTASLDTTGRPLVEPNGAVAQNPVAVGRAAAYGVGVGSLHGLPVVTDPNIPTDLGAGTNEDVVLIGRADDWQLWEQPTGDVPFLLRFEQPLASQLTVRLVAYGYSAFTAGRYPASTAVITGTGLVTPVL